MIFFVITMSTQRHLDIWIYIYIYIYIYGIDIYMVHLLTSGRHSRTLNGTWVDFCDQKCYFALSLKALARSFHVGVARISGGGVVCHWWAFFFSFSFPLLIWKLQLGSFCCWYLNFNPYFFIYNFSLLALLEEFYWFLISYFNLNL